jgi:hypothetical protein
MQKVSASFGVAMVEAGDSSDSVVQRPDQALHLAERQAATALWASTRQVNINANEA